MKKLIFLLIFILLPYSVFSLTIDPELETTLNTEDNVKAIVILEETPQKNIVGIKQDIPRIDEIERKFSNGFIANLSREDIDVLETNKNVKGIFLDKKYYIELEESKPIINSLEVNKIIINNKNITGSTNAVCVLDTGIDYAHEDFGYCDTGILSGGACTKIIGSYDFYNNDVNPLDQNGHGTHVSGIIAANGTIKGIAQDTRLVSMKVCNDDGVCSGAAIASALDYCIQNKTKFNITAISISIGSSELFSNYCDSQSPFTTLVNEAIRNNITVVAAAGNDGSTTGISEPACIENVTAVTASYDFTGTYTGSCNDENANPDKIACFSNRNNLIDLVAPGAVITSTNVGSGSATRSGTSAATPHISGIISLLQDYNKLNTNSEMNPVELLNLIKITGNVINESGVNYIKPDSLKALNGLDKTIPNLTVISPVENSLYNKTLQIEYSVSDNNLDSCFYNLNEEINVSMQNCNNVTIELSKINNSIIIYANDTNNNLNFKTVNFEADLLEVTLLSPENNSTHNSKALSFSCQAKTSELSNLVNSAIYFNFNNKFIVNETKQISGYNNQTTFNIMNLPDGIYEWNCLYNSNGFSSFATENYTITIDTSSPIISSLANLTVNSNSATINWNTNELSNSTLQYSISQNGQKINIDNTTRSNSHQIILTGLTAQTTYYYNAVSCDILGNCASSPQQSFRTSDTDTTIPIINSITVSSINSTEATLTWNTNELTNETVHYGLTSSTTSKISNLTYSILHNKKLESLIANSTYFFNITTCDQSDNCNTSKQYNFTTIITTNDNTGNPPDPSGSSPSGGGSSKNEDATEIKEENKAEENQNTPINSPANSPVEDSGLSVSSSGNDEKENSNSGLTSLLGNTIRSFSDLSFMGMPIKDIKESINFIKNNSLISVIILSIVALFAGLFVAHKKVHIMNKEQKNLHKEFIADYHNEDNEKL